LRLRCKGSYFFGICNSKSKKIFKKNAFSGFRDIEVAKYGHLHTVFRCATTISIPHTNRIHTIETSEDSPRCSQEHEL